MNRKKELQRQLGGRYSYERLLSDREIQRIGKRIPADFSETAAAVLTAGCLFHLHRQVMFVNYLPFLLLSFLSIRKKQTKWLPLCLCLIWLNSFHTS